MAIQTIKKITAWSFSRWSDYEKCPALAKYKHIDKIKEPGNAAMDRGNVIDKLCGDYTVGKIKKLPKELAYFKDQFAELKKSKPIVQETWAFTQKWALTTWDDWANCWVRIKTDAACLDGDDLYVIDDKTGKAYETHALQMSLYGLAGLLKFPKVKRVISQLWYLDNPDPRSNVAEATFERAQLHDLVDDWEKKTKPMLNDTRFAPKPGNHCRWCHFSKSKGGPCKF